MDKTQDFLQPVPMPGVVVLGSDFKALGVVRSLGQRGIPCVVIDNNPRSAWFSRYVVRRFKWPTHMEGEKFITFLLNIAKTYCLEQWVLFPTQDEVVQLIACNTPQLSQLYRLVTQDWDVIRWANDKRLTYRMAEEVGVPYPKTSYVTHKSELATLDIPFPVIIKPAISVRFQYATHLKALPAGSSQELLTQYETATASIIPDEVMIQEIIPGDGRVQYSIATFCEDGHIKTWMTARRTRQYPIDYGLGSSFVEAVEVPALFPLAEKLLCHMRVSGMVEVEFKYDERDQQYKLLDINVRPWGWHTLCIPCGLDLPYMQYCFALGYPLPALPTSIDYGYHWVRVLTDIPAGIQEIRAGITTPAAYLRSLKGKAAFSVLDWHDPLPAFGDVWTAVSRVIRSKLRKT
jgi:predicted ATP-grasp superfamily ATP-dependent carboligase